MSKLPKEASTPTAKKRPISEVVAGTSAEAARDITPTEAGDPAVAKAGDGPDGGHRVDGGNVAKKSKISETAATKTTPAVDVKKLDFRSNPTKREHLVDKVNVTLKAYMEKKEKVSLANKSSLYSPCFNQA